MHVPTADELAAITAAYVAATARVEPPPEPSRWQLAGRLPEVDDRGVRFAAAAASRWSAAGRLDG